ncbi:uncharacterized protein SCHCODRAFT_02489146 [Schizophyllum commune H4-8]|uniref:Myb/SANT-like domain-containing protein n=1 Tax=Schizophyllum commune (strain H4-8 / FGSC 9210) TaxID=578458 RepID=D8PM81_SCHCM|nr:uncharacterized protein SCHCODRAFT_02521388 [Schizophyllum commune H4-8]XP_050201931.1 uncharacterized protein SCHCODRAFT_02489146 [Schizophyllum commune H4-8]KAI5885233.1 hypothetical protein SCHCODRAFT_02521388 [Schizophyllum commune H4-8]KAI5897291.1 hypothetical protein SCHCODRAFT_02489146 [Schizophyllum commune H4-8]
MNLMAGTKHNHICRIWKRWCAPPKAGQGGNFPEDVFSGCVKAIAHLRERGAVKTAKHVRAKYREVSRVNCYVIHMIKKRSRWTYSVQNGANIDDTNKTLWIEFIDGLEATYRTAANKFRNRGWPLFNKINEILPERAKGKHAYYAGRRQTQPLPQSALQGTAWVGHLAYKDLSD